MDKVVFDYSKLRGRIAEKFGIGRQKEFAREIGISPTSLSLKLNNKGYFDQGEIQRSVDVLGIEAGTVATYFFARKL